MTEMSVNDAVALVAEASGASVGPSRSILPEREPKFS